MMKFLLHFYLNRLIVTPEDAAKDAITPEVAANMGKEVD
jgi:hypothetical protein